MLRISPRSDMYQASGVRCHHASSLALVHTFKSQDSTLLIQWCLTLPIPEFRNHFLRNLWRETHFRSRPWPTLLRKGSSEFERELRLPSSCSHWSHGKPTGLECSTLVSSASSQQPSGTLVCGWGYRCGPQAGWMVCEPYTQQVDGQMSLK